MASAKALAMACCALVLAATAGTAHARDPERPAAVVELFTSQGCSSCPPADEMLRDMAIGGDVIALGYHVDYWDYLGWRDTLGSAENTARQREYGQAFGARSVYTPQAVVNGRAHFNGAKRDKVEAAIGEMARSGEGLLVDVAVSHRGDSLVVETGAAPGVTGDAQIVIVYFGDVAEVTIGEGRNKGRTIEYWNAVTGFHTVGMWQGGATRIELPRSEIARKAEGGCAILIQRMAAGGMPGPIIGAALVGADRLR